MTFCKTDTEIKVPDVVIGLVVPTMSWHGQ